MSCLFKKEVRSREESRQLMFAAKLNLPVLSRQGKRPFPFCVRQGARLLMLRPLFTHPAQHNVPIDNQKIPFFILTSTSRVSRFSGQAHHLKEEDGSSTQNSLQTVVEAFAREEVIFYGNRHDTAIHHQLKRSYLLKMPRICLDRFYHPNQGIEMVLVHALSFRMSR